MRKFGLLLTALTTFLIPCFGSPTATIVKSDPKMRAQVDGEYHFVFEGFPVNRKIDMLLHRVMQPVFRQVHTLKFDAKGNVQINDHAKQPIFGLNSIGFVPGERVTYRFQDGDKVLCETSCIPKPLIAVSKEGTFRMEGELLTFNLTTWQLKFQGIEEGELLFSISTSCGEVLSREYEYRSNTIRTLCPEVLGEEGGLNEVTIRRLNGDQAVLVMPWGSEILAELRAQKALFDRSH